MLSSIAANFLKSLVDERSQIIRSKSLCFGCFKSGHVSSRCQNPSTCKECGRYHHTLLHGVKPRSTLSKQPNPKAHENQQSSSKKETPSEKTPVKESASSNLISVVHSSAGESTSLITNCKIFQGLCALGRCKWHSLCHHPSTARTRYWRRWTKFGFEHNAWSRKVNGTKSWWFGSTASRKTHPNWLT